MAKTAGGISKPPLAIKLSATANVTDTGAAAAYTPLPAWLAVMVHEPAATSVSVLPLTVQILVVVDVKLTARPDEALAVKAAAAVSGGVALMAWVPGDVKVMVCGVGATVNEFETCGAAE